SSQTLSTHTVSVSQRPRRPAVGEIRHRTVTMPRFQTQGERGTYGIVVRRRATVLLLLGGIALAAAGGRPAGARVIVGAGSVLTLIGVLMSVPWAVTFIGWASSRMPLSWRLAARQAARNRTRSAAAIAVVGAALAGTIAVGIIDAADVVGPPELTYA